MSISKELGAKIKMLRRASNLMQEDVARFLGIGKSSVSEWESGKRTPGIDQISDLATILNTSPGYLMGWEAPSLPDVELRMLKYDVAHRSISALNLAWTYDQLDEWGKKLLLTTAEMLKEKHHYLKKDNKDLPEVTAARNVITPDGDEEAN